jgi:hypothetical protein
VNIAIAIGVLLIIVAALAVISAAVVGGKNDEHIRRTRDE